MIILLFIAFKVQSISSLVNLQSCKVCHGFRFTKRDDYFWVNFDHFWIEQYFWRNIENCLESPSGNLACPNIWNTLESISSTFYARFSYESELSSFSIFGAKNVDEIDTCKKVACVLRNICREPLQQQFYHLTKKKLK